jgi:hypothetical protein
MPNSLAPGALFEVELILTDISLLHFNVMATTGAWRSQGNVRPLLRCMWLSEHAN